MLAVAFSVDVVLHLAGDGAALAGLLTGKGRLASTLGLGPDLPVSRTYSLAEVPAAFGDFASGTVGKLAVAVA